MMKRLNNLKPGDLSLEMKVCYFLQPWNDNSIPNTVEEWAEEVGFCKYKEQETSDSINSAIEKAINDATYYIEFIKKHVASDN
ncbi:hypothetical protein ABEX78_19120 [Priestia megaterium]